MKLKITNGGLPQGVHKGEFVGVDAVTNDYGDGLVWKWKLADGAIAKLTTGANPTMKNSCGRTLMGLSGKGLGDEVDVNDFIGRMCILVVGPSDNGGTKITAVTPA